MNNTTGYFNTASGARSLRSNTTGSNNTVSGSGSLYSNTTGSRNTAFGADALYSNTADDNAAFGNTALNKNTTGTFNAAVGALSLYSNTVGSFNMAFGGGALYSNTTGINNAAQGALALQNNTTGSQNLGIGAASGFGITTGSNNVFLGYNAGAFAAGNSSNKLYISSNANTPLLYGVFSETPSANKLGIGTQTVSAAQAINVWNGAHLTTGGVWTNASSRELKDNIENLSAKDANAALDALSPVRYVYKNSRDEEYVGFIAEDVPELVATNDHKSLSPMDIVAVLTTVVKEEKTKVADQQIKMAEKDAEIAAQKFEIAELKEHMLRMDKTNEERMLQMEMALAEVLRHQSAEAQVSLAN